MRTTTNQLKSKLPRIGNPVKWANTKVNQQIQKLELKIDRLQGYGMTNEELQNWHNME